MTPAGNDMKHMIYTAEDRHEVRPALASAPKPMLASGENAFSDILGLHMFMNSVLQSRPDAERTRYLVH